ncbi:MAG: chemotaxis protein CheB, partial [Shimia sp.]
MSEIEPTFIVAIGASAGGLEACEQFFDATPTDEGLAYVIIQHLSPDFRSLMDQLLARHSSMPIQRARDGMQIEANHIYLNGPREALAVEDGVFKVEEKPRDDEVSLPINYFFSSLAEDAGERAIGVILSGTGSDGTKGARTLKDAGGTVLVQEPGSAKFDGMPNSAIRAEVADGVATPKSLPELIKRRMAGEELSLRPKHDGEAGEPLSDIFGIMRERFGTDFGYYKSETIERRIRRRCDLRGHSTIADYVAELTVNRDEVDSLYSNLLIEVTAFFRDGESFELLEEEVIPEVAKRMSAENQIRVWVPGCASGEEAYSLAILFSEYAREHDVPLNLKIMATDIHHRSLDAASAGIYSK